jgi:hypothetical protein
MMLNLTPAIQEKSNLRLALAGPSGSGKTWTALRIMGLLLGGSPRENGVALNRREDGKGRVALIDTERGSARLYSSNFPTEDNPQVGFFDVMEMPRNARGVIEPQLFIDAMRLIASHGYEGLIFDSFTHPWDSILDKKDQLDNQKGGSKNSFTNWRDITPLHNAIVDTALNFPGHLIATLRMKSEYVIEKDGGQTVIRKVGNKAMQRDDLGFEFSIVFDMERSEGGVIVATVSKNRCTLLTEPRYTMPGENIANPLHEWLGTGVTPAMTRDAFVLEMAALGYGDNSAIASVLEDMGLKGLDTRDKYRDMLTAVKATLDG